MLKKIEGYSDYLVSDKGEVFSAKFGKMRQLKFGVHKNGYRYVVLCKNGTPKSFQIHILVANAFLIKPKGKLEVNHKDCNKQNNNVNNLEWCTRGENMKHAFQNKLLALTFNEEHRSAKLTKKDVLEIRSKYKPRTYSYNKLAKEYGITKQSVISVVKNETWKNVL